MTGVLKRSSCSAQAAMQQWQTPRLQGTVPARTPLPLRLPLLLLGTTVHPPASSPICPALQAQHAARWLVVSRQLAGITVPRKEDRVESTVVALGFCLEGQVRNSA